jgi:hypothetical protein
MITSLSLDSRFADQQFAGTGDFLIRLPSTIKNVTRVALVSVELPAGATDPYYLIQLLTPDPLEAVQHPLGGGDWVGAFAKTRLAGDSCVRQQEYTFPCPANIATVRVRLLDSSGAVACPVTHAARVTEADWSLTLDCHWC